MRTLLVALLWLGTVVAAFLLGGAGQEGPDRESAPVPAAERLPAAALRGHDAGRMREVAPSAASTVKVHDGRPSEAHGGGPVSVAGDLPPFDLAGVSSADEAYGRFAEHVAALLARGEAGHMALLMFLDQHVVKNADLETLFGSPQEAARFIYPLVKFLVERDAQVLDLTETLFKTMADDPQAFAAFDDDTLEVFTEGVAFLLPGAVDESRMDSFRSYAARILETPEAEQPAAVARNRRRIERVLGVWAPKLAPDAAVARLQSGEASAQEVLSLLKNLPVEQRTGLDLGMLLAPVVASGDYQAIRMLGQVGLEDRDLLLLDRAAMEGLASGRFNEWTLRQYLDATGRGSWPAGQPFIEVALASAEPMRSKAAMTLSRLGPPKEYVQWVVETQDLTEATRKKLGAAFGLSR